MLAWLGTGARRAVQCSAPAAASRSARISAAWRRVVGGMFQREQARLGVEHADVERRAQLVDFADQRRAADQVADAHAGQAELAHRAHHQHMRVLRAARRGIESRAANGW
jgi:hypothetical protein